MPSSPHNHEPLFALPRTVVLGAAVGVLCGAGSALFLWLLELVTALRTGQPTIVYALPVAGLAIGWIYQRVGEQIKAGNNLVIDTLNNDGAVISARMAPMVLAGTVLTHLFGGSAGREGTAVQMGASLADTLSHLLGIRGPLRLQLLTAGIAGGFGSVFGTPVAGVVFSLELAVLGRIEHQALLAALTAALVGDLTTRAFGIAHTPYPALEALALSPLLIAKWCLFAAAIALSATLFIELVHALKRLGERFLPNLALRMFVGGVLLIAMWRAVGSDEYLGLGIPTIVRSFEDPTLPAYSFALKLCFTAVTIAAGFLGGEVTPLFFIGAALGNGLARVLDLPLALGAGMGMAGLFAAAANTPLAVSIMAVELLGVGALPHILIVSVLAYTLKGRRSIYSAQRVAVGEYIAALPIDLAVAELARAEPERRD